MESYAHLATPDVHVAELDPTNFPPPEADSKLLELWNLHGHLYSYRYTNPDLTSLSAIIRWNAALHPDQTAYLVPDNDSMSAYRRISYVELDRLISAVAAHYADVFACEIAAANATTSSGGPQQPTIALIGVGISFDYYVTIHALLRLHVRVLLLSNKNARTAHQHLLRQCAAVGCIVDAANAAAVTREDGNFRQAPIPFARVDSMDVEKTDAGDHAGFRTDDEWNLPSVIIHSSGTTGMPKPIVHTNRSICMIARHHRLFRDFYIANFQICAPLFHIGGFSVAIGSLPIGLVGTFPPPNWPPATSALLAGWTTLDAMGCAVDAVQIAPALVEDMYAYIASTSNDFRPLSRLKVVQSGGAPFAPALLAKLVARSVNMKTIYGQTEIAGPMRTLPHGRENPHMARLRNLYAGTGWVELEDLGTGDGSAECVVYRDFPLAAQLWEQPDAPNPYRTNDVLREDPPGSGFWVLLGRKDDVVVHSNGEKTMAGGVATALQGSSPLILNAAVFGANRPCTAAVIGLRWDALPAEHADDPARVKALVWEAVDSVNAQIPRHSRIDRALVLILDRDEILPVTPKRTVKRKIAWDLFGARIDALFDAFLQLDGSDAAANVATEGQDERRAALDGMHLSDDEYVCSCVRLVCDVPAATDLGATTFYEINLDSQRAVRLRALLMRRFGGFPLVFLFENPTVSQLVTFLQSRRDASSAEQETQGARANEEARLDWIRKAIAGYCKEVNEWAALPNGTATDAIPSPQNCIYLTGANGALGNALIEQFVHNPAITTVYSAVRGKKDTVQQKLVASLTARGYGADIYNSPKLCAIPYDMADAHLGLDTATWAHLQQNVSIVVHTAWRLDFNQPVMRFTNDCLRGHMHLLAFCAAQNGARPKTFAFTSSISAVMGHTSGNYPEAPASDDPRTAGATGYAQSKYIAERVAQHYANTLNAPVCMLRVGQLCGETKRGVWNVSEMWPIMMATGLSHLHAMPVFPPAAQRVVNWLPVDLCAAAAAHCILSLHAACSAPTYQVHNLTNPKTVPWDGFLDLLETAAIAAGGSLFARLSVDEWVMALEARADAVDGATEDVPGLKLLPYFQTMVASADKKQVGAQTQSVSGQLLDVTAVGKWLARWCESGFLQLK